MIKAHIFNKAHKFIKCLFPPVLSTMSKCLIRRFYVKNVRIIGITNFAIDCLSLHIFELNNRINLVHSAAKHEPKSNIHSELYWRDRGLFIHSDRFDHFIFLINKCSPYIVLITFKTYISYSWSNKVIAANNNFSGKGYKDSTNEINR